MQSVPRPARAWVRYRLRRALLYHPILAPYYARATAAGRSYLVHPDSDLVIDGYPRSANTFAVLAFTMANPTGVRLAHHLHSPVNIERAVSFAVPAIVLIRTPRDAIASHLVRSPWIRPQDALRGYLTFYERITRLTNSVIIAAYPQVISNFGQIITAANTRFGTTFMPYRATADNDQTIFDHIDHIDHAARTEQHGELDPARVSRPHRARTELTQQALRKLDHPRLQPLIAHADELHRTLTTGSSPGGR